MIAIGKDDLKVTVENYQYSSKKKTLIWKDERYTVLENLREDAIAKLEEISKPYRSYGADIIDLANTSNKYSILAYGLGDTITLISKDKGIKEKQRIVKITEYPEEPHRNNCEIANGILSFTDIQKEYNDTVDTVSNITIDNGTVNGSAINAIKTEQIKDFEANVVRVTDLTVVNARIDKLYAEKADVGTLNAVEIRVGNIEATKANITQLNAVEASIVNLQANKANITDLTASVGRIEILESSVGDIKTLVNGNLTSNNIQSLILSSDKVTVANGFIKNAMIENLDVSKILAGDISTNKFRIKSDNGGIEIVGATQQFKDKNNRVRIQMGQDALGNFNFILRGEDGTTTLIDHTGIKENAIGDDLIKSNMISENAVGGKQIDYNSFTEEFNADTNTNTLKSSKVLLDENNQTLNVAFNQLDTKVDGVKTTTESNTTAINVQQGKISTLISNTTIVKDGQNIQLKDAYNSTVATVDSINSVISSHTSNIDALTGQITGVETKTNEVRRDLDGTIETVSSATITANSALSKATEAKQTADGFSQRVSNIETNYATTSAMNSAISQKADSIKLEVSKDFVSKNDATLTYATKSSLTQTENSIVAKFTSSGGYNLLKNSAFANKDTVNWGGSNVGVYRGNDSYFMPEYGCIAIQLGSGNRGVFLQVLSETLIKNKTYTLSLKSWREQNVTVRCVIDYYNGSTWVSATGLTIINDKSKRQNHTFTVPDVTFTKTQIYFEFNRVAGTTGYVVTSLEKPCLCDGDVAVWSPHPSELIDGSTQIDANGVTIFNGAIDVRNRAGASVLKGDSNGNLMVRGNLYADPANPILHLFEGCSLDATYQNEQGIGSAVRLKWNASNYLYVATNDVSIFQNGNRYYEFTTGYLSIVPATTYFANQCKIDCAGGTFRMYISKTVDTGIRVLADGTVSFLVNGVQKHIFYTNGTKAGGTIELDGVNLGMSPIDSPQVLLESVLFDIDVQEEGTTVVLDSTFLKTISTYAVFCSNHNVDIVSKDRTSFYVQGYTGKVDFRIIGYRIGYEEQYYQVVG